jgi:DNA-binding transcriptional MerR regulator
MRTLSRVELMPGAVARIMGISYHTLWDWGNKGKGPKFHLVAAQRRYYYRDVEEWLQQEGAE